MILFDIDSLRVSAEATPPTPPSSSSSDRKAAVLVLSDEEKRLLSEEGITLPTDMPLTKVSWITMHSISKDDKLATLYQYSKSSVLRTRSIHS